MKLSAQQFEETKTRILLMDDKQKSEIANLLNSGTVVKRKVLERGDTPGFRLHKITQQVLFSRNGTNIPSLGNLKTIQPSLFRQFEAVGRQFEEELDRMFPKVTVQERWGLIHYFTRMASHRLDDMDKLVSAGNLLEALVPLSELVDDQLPGYRSAGILHNLVLRHLSKENPCLDRTP